MKVIENNDLPSLNILVKPLALGVFTAIAVVVDQPVYADSARLVGDSYVVAS